MLFKKQVKRLETVDQCLTRLNRKVNIFDYASRVSFCFFLLTGVGTIYNAILDRDNDADLSFYLSGLSLVAFFVSMKVHDDSWEAYQTFKQEKDETLPSWLFEEEVFPEISEQEMYN